MAYFRSHGLSHYHRKDLRSPSTQHETQVVVMRLRTYVRYDLLIKAVYTLRCTSWRVWHTWWNSWQAIANKSGMQMLWMRHYGINVRIGWWWRYKTEDLGNQSSHKLSSPSRLSLPPLLRVVEYTDDVTGQRLRFDVFQMLRWSPNCTSINTTEGANKMPSLIAFSFDRQYTTYTLVMADNETKPEQYSENHGLHSLCFSFLRLYFKFSSWRCGDCHHSSSQRRIMFFFVQKLPFIVEKKCHTRRRYRPSAIVRVIRLVNIRWMHS